MTRHRQDTSTLSSEARGLLAALRAEYAAVYTYGLIAAYSRPDRRQMIAVDVAAHRTRRDALVQALTAASVAVPVADPGYTTPTPVTDPKSAATLAVSVENATAVAWRSALERATSETTRQSCVETLDETALRLAKWRDILGVTPPTTPFPGKS